jgi:two-component system response regulator
MRSSTPSPLEILVAEDNYADVRWLQLILVEAQIHHTLSIAYDGEQALNFLQKTGAFICAPDPDLVFIDLNMPKLTGVQILEALDSIDRLPVCILTSSPLEREIVLRRFQMDERRYILKPIDRAKLVDALDCFEHLERIAAGVRALGA